MKLMRSFVVISTLLCSIVLGFFGSERAYAQSSVTVEQILQHTSSIIDEKLRALTNEMTYFGSTHGDKTTTEYKQYAETNAAEATMVRNARTAFETTLTAASSRTPTQLYSDALLAASKSLTDQSAANPVLQRPQATTFISAFKTELATEAINQERIRAISTGQALSPEAQAFANATIVAANPGSKTKENKECSLFAPTNIGACAYDLFLWIIKTLFLNIAGFLLWVMANMLNYAIQVGVLNFSAWAPDSLYPIWLVIRQITSLFVVFAGLWLGFMYIINKGDQFKKYIPWVVIFALFVNFSYPIVRVMVDVSNVISLNIYASAVGSKALTADSTSQNTAGAIIMNKLGLQGLVSSATKVDEAGSGAALTSVKTIPGALMVVAFVLYAAYIFFMVTSIIVMRTAVLVFLIVASPLLLVDSVIPKLGDKASDLRKMFFEQLAVGPVFMIMLALTLKFLEVFSVAGKAGVANGNGGETIKELFGVLMMLIMLHIMIKVTKSTAGSMGQVATNFMGKVGGFAGGMAGGVALGGAGMLGRATIGRGAAALRDSKWMEGRQGGFIGRKMYTMTDSVAKSGFDARNTSFVQKGGAKMGIGFGMGNTKGFEEIEESRRKNLENHLGRIGTHKKNTYTTDANGNMVIKNRKGDIDTSDEAQGARRQYIQKAGTSMFATKQENQDTTYKLLEANKAQNSAQTNKILADFNALENKNADDQKKIADFIANYSNNPNLKQKLEEANKKKVVTNYEAFSDTPQGKADKKQYLERQNPETQARLVELDKKKALTEYKSFEDTEQGRKEKFDFYTKQDPETRKRLDEYETRTEMDKDEKREARSDSKRFTQSQEKIASLLEQQLAQSRQSSSPTSSTNTPSYRTGEPYVPERVDYTLGNTTPQEIASARNQPNNTERGSTPNYTQGSYGSQNLVNVSYNLPNTTQRRTSEPTPVTPNYTAGNYGPQNITINHNLPNTQQGEVSTPNHTQGNYGSKIDPSEPESLVTPTPNTPNRPQRGAVVPPRRTTDEPLNPLGQNNKTEGVSKPLNLDEPEEFFA